MPRKKRWTEEKFKNGYGEVRISSWRYFMDYVYQEMLDHQTYIWRGQRRQAWKLTTTWDRLCERSKRDSADQALLGEHLERFKLAARGRRGGHPPRLENDNDWWALAQHFDLSTPLLDWTTSPFVAAYFAYIGKGKPQTAYRAVYALHRPGVVKKADDIRQAKVKENAERKASLARRPDASPLAMALYDRPVQPEIEFIRPMSDENQNLLNQGGLFSRSPTGKTLESWVMRNFAGETDFTLMKILLPDADRTLALRTLNRMNINHSSLFPDLYGASVFTNMFVQIDLY